MSFWKVVLVAAFPTMGLFVIKNLDNVATHVRPPPSSLSHSAPAAMPRVATGSTLSREPGFASLGSSVDGALAPFVESTSGKASIQAIVDGTNQPDQQWSAILKLARAQESSSRVKVSPNLANLGSERIEKGVLQLVSIPKDGPQFDQVFGKVPNDDVIVRTRAVADKLIDDGALEVPNSLSDFEATLSSRQERLVLITGHNEGGVFKLSKGTLLLNSMAETCAKVKKICVFLSCSSGKHVGREALGLPLTVTYDEAVRMSSLVIAFNRYAGLQGANYLDLVTALPIILAVENVKMNTRIVVRYVAPAGGVGVGIFVLTSFDA